MILGTCPPLAVAGVMPARKSLPIAGKTSFNEAAADVGTLYETLSNNTVPICWPRPSIARSAVTHLYAPHLLAFDKSTQLLGGLVITGALSFWSVNATQADPRGPAALGQKHDIVPINYRCSAGQLSAGSCRAEGSKKTRKLL
jgi:hypothetical protein